jgi:hypothetical protein
MRRSIDAATTRAGILPARGQRGGPGARRTAAGDLRSLVIAPVSAKRTPELLDSCCAGATLNASSVEDYDQWQQRSIGALPPLPPRPDDRMKPCT